MKYHATVEASGVLYFACEGEADLRSHLDFLDAANADAERLGVRLALLDMRRVVPAMDDEDHVALGAYAAAGLDALAKVATVVQPQYRTGQGEAAAQQVGLRLRTFTDVEQARSWLLE